FRGVPSSHGSNESGRAARGDAPDGGLPVEAWRNRIGGRDRGCVGRLAALAPVPARAANDPNHRSRAMNPLSGLKPILDDLRGKFGAQIDKIHTVRADEIHAQTKLESVGALCAWFYRKWNGRIASLFAEDARHSDETFFIHFIFAIDSAHGFF